MGAIVGSTDSSSAELTRHLHQSTPDGSVYSDPLVFRTELERLYFRNWLCVAREDQLPTPGDYLTRKIGPESLIFVRDQAGDLHGFYNVCRHRGTRLLERAEGSGLTSIICPYHTWNYNLDGRLLGAGHMREVEGFRKEKYGLFPVRTDSWGGFLWVNLEPEGPSLRDELGKFFEVLARVPVASLKLGARKVYSVEANWKILVENYSECYHCASIHPELNRITHYMSGANTAYFLSDGGRAKFAGGNMTFARDYTSMTRSGYTKRPPLPGLAEEDRKRVSYWVIFPNLFFSLHPDYLMIHRSWPDSPTHTTIENEFYFDPAVMAEADFDPSDAVDLWDEINRQDWNVCEQAQQGTMSRAWHGGRYSEQEALVCDFDLFVRDQMQAR